MMTLDGRTAVITGAAGGIGRALAGGLAARRCNLALADVNATALAQAAAELSATGVRISTHVLDVSDAAAVAALPDQVAAVHPGVELLFNNAGVALGGTFEQVSAVDFEWLIGVNFWGVVRMTRAFLPLLKAADQAQLVNISSVFGLIAPPGQTAYVASKFAVRGFSESLRHELAKTSVGITVVHPGGVDTAIAKSARVHGASSPEEIERSRKSFQMALILPPAAAAETILRAVERQQPRVIVGRDARIAAIVERLAPVSYWKWLQRLAPRPSAASRSRAA